MSDTGSGAAALPQFGKRLRETSFCDPPGTHGYQRAATPKNDFQGQRRVRRRLRRWTEAGRMHECNFRTMATKHVLRAWNTLLSCVNRTRSPRTIFRPQVLRQAPARNRIRSMSPRDSCI